MKTILMFLTILLLASCSSRKRIVERQLIKVTDTTYVTITVMDTIMVARPADTATVTVPIAQLKDTAIQKKSKHASIQLTEKAGIVSATCLCDSLQILVKQYEKTITRLRSELDQRTIPVITNELNGWQRLMYTIGLIVTLLLATAGIWKLIQNRFNRGKG